MAQDYPKMIYKYMDKTSYKIVHSFEEEEASVKEGYGESKIMLHGEKPEGLEETKQEEPKKAEKPKRKRRTSAQVAAEKKPEVVEPKEESKEEEPKGE